MNVDHVPSRDSEICIQTGCSLSPVETTNDSCNEDNFMQRVSASQRRGLDIGPAFDCTVNAISAAITES